MDFITKNKRRKGRKRIMAIGAHFDDIEINCGGTLAKAVSGGAEILMVVLADGKYDYYDGTKLRTRYDAQNESKAAATELGIHYESILCLNLPEKKIVYDVKLVELLERIINEFKPDLILTHWIYDTHQDHSNTCRAVISAGRYHHSILMWGPIFPSGKMAGNVFHPQIYIDITDFHEKKISSIRSHKTQLSKFKGRGIRWIEGIIARDKYNGFEASYKYAEAFQPVQLRLDI